MNFGEFQPYILPALIAAFFLWRFLRFRGVKNQIPRLLAEGGKIVDVRSPGEFASGSSQWSVNIPLFELASRLGELDREKPVVLCCASGTRSGMAVAILKRNGFRNVTNAGPWTNTWHNASTS